MSTMRRLKWHPPPPPSPRILYLPRRHRRKLSKTAGRPIFGRDPPDPGRTLKGKLSTLFSEEQRTVISRRSVSIARLSSADMGKRGRVKEEEEGKEGEEEEEEVGGEIERGIQEEKWRFQAEILRAECNFLRAEREFALKKLDRNRVQLERTLGSAVQALIGGRKKIREGKSMGRLLEEEIKKLAKKLREMQGNAEGPDFRVRKCSNFDRQAFLLQKRLEKIGGVSDDDKCMKQIQKIAESSLSINACSTLDGELLPNRKPPDPSSTDVEILRRKMEGLSKGMLLEKMEAELGSVLSTAIISPSATTSATLTPIDYSDSSSSSSIRPPSQESAGHEESTCEGQCKAVVRRVMEQVRAETEQWTQMQQILAQVREEMEDLEASRDFWEEEALHSNFLSQSLRSHLKDWKKRAVTSEAKANELQAQISVLHGELEKLRRDQSTEALKRVSRDAQQTEKEKRVLICQLKENDQVKKKEKGAFIEGRKKVQISSHALKDIANVSPLLLRHYKK